MEQRQSEESHEPAPAAAKASSPGDESTQTPAVQTQSAPNQVTDNQSVPTEPAPTAEQPTQRNTNQPRSGQREGDRRENRQPNTQRDATQRNFAQRDATQRDNRHPNVQRDAAQREASQGDGEQRDNRQANSQRDANQRNFAQRETTQRENKHPNVQRDAAQRETSQGENGKRPEGRRQENRSNERGGRNRNEEAESRERAPIDRESTARESTPPDASSEQSSRGDRLVIGISLGDYNGIGPEVILKALQYNRLQKLCTPVIYGSMRVLNRYRNLLNLKDWNLNGAPTIGQISHKMTNVITCWPDQNQDIQPGQVTPEAGQAAFVCLQRAVDDLKDGKLDALVTAPINKYNIQSEEFKFPGHTEYLAQAFDVKDNLMFMVSDTLRVGVVTGHIPLGRVRQNVTREAISQKLTLMMQSLKQDFGLEKPKIAVLGLNPHAGEEGLLGNEEQDVIKPLLAEWRNKGHLVFGPYPADGFFGTRNYSKFDAILAMYHDQGLIPFKAIAFEEGVNFTAGMPAVRTSPDHGTAYDIAGKNLADETSMLRAIYTAIDVARQRKEYIEITANALK